MWGRGSVVYVCESELSASFFKCPSVFSLWGRCHADRANTHASVAVSVLQLDLQVESEVLGDECGIALLKVILSSGEHVVCSLFCTRKGGEMSIPTT